MAEDVILEEAENDGEELKLMDGRRLTVNPGDIPTTILWLPTTELEIVDTDDQMFPLVVRNKENDEKVRAMWLM